MALAARCPHCGALFRVVADQLKLRGGMVRCGDCRRVFDAIGSLSYVDDHSLVPGQGEAPIAGSAVPGPAAAAPSAPVPVSVRPRTPVAPAPPKHPSAAPQVRGSGRRAPPGPDEPGAELWVPTLIGSPEPEPTYYRSASNSPAPEARIEPTVTPRSASSKAASSRGGESDVRDRRSDYRVLVRAEPDQDTPAASPDQEPQLDAPSFLLTRNRLRERRLRQALLAGSAVLAVLAVIQIALVMRDNLLEGWPALRPLLARACGPYRCTVGWPEHAELLTTVGSELAAIPGTDVIELNAAIRSRAPFVMALPAIEITLTDIQNRTIARKVFLPVDYLASSGEPSSRIDEGLAPESDLSIRLEFEARGLNAAGFVVYPFYL